MTKKNITLKGVNPTILTKFIKKTATIDDSVKIYIFNDRIISLKDNIQETTSKMCGLRFDEFLENKDELYNQIGDLIINLSLFSAKKFVKDGLMLFKDSVDIDITYDEENGNVIDFVTIYNNSIKIKFSVANADNTFKKINNGWEFVNKFFSEQDALASFNLSADELKKIKVITKMETIIDKKHEFINIKTVKGFITVSTHSVDLTLHETNIELDSIKIKNDLIPTICDENYNVYLKVLNNINVLVIISTESNTAQAFQLLSDMNTNIDLSDLEDELGKASFEDWDDIDSNPLF